MKKSMSPEHMAKLHAGRDAWHAAQPKDGVVRKRALKRGVVNSMIEFFQRNPGEWLTVADMAAKFSCSQRTVINALPLVRQSVKVSRASVFFAEPGDVK